MALAVVLEHPLAELPPELAPAEILALGQAEAQATALAAAPAGEPWPELAGARATSPEAAGRQVAEPLAVGPLADAATLAERPFRWASSWRAWD